MELSVRILERDILVFHKLNVCDTTKPGEGRSGEEDFHFTGIQERMALTTQIITKFL